jgi:PilZ domain-containing protein
MGAELRKATRRRVAQQALMLREDGSIIGTCTMLDVSAGGARLKIAAETVAPSEFTLLLSKVNAAMRRRCIVAWQEKQNIGVRFLPL